MSKADERFKKLGYEKVTKVINKGEEKFANGTKYIIFVTETNPKIVHIDKSVYITADHITMEMLKAINEKCKELEWLDE